MRCQLGTWVSVVVFQSASQGSELPVTGGVHAEGGRCLLRILKRAFLGGGVDGSEVPFIPWKLGFKEPSLLPTAQSCLLSTLLLPPRSFIWQLSTSFLVTVLVLPSCLVISDFTSSCAIFLIVFCVH